jgi:hypothetical protein
MKMTSSGIPLKLVRAKSVELTPSGHGSDKNRMGGGCNFVEVNWETGKQYNVILFVKEDIRFSSFERDKETDTSDFSTII